MNQKKKNGGGDSRCYVCLCLFCREDDVNELENKKSSTRKQWVRPIFQDKFSATFFQTLFFISRSSNSPEVLDCSQSSIFRKIIEIEHFALQAAILHECQNLKIKIAVTVRRGISKRSHEKIGDCEQSIEVFSYKTGNCFGESRHIENCS